MKGEEPVEERDETDGDESVNGESGGEGEEVVEEIEGGHRYTIAKEDLSSKWLTK